ncbi:MAG: 6,7-dimethyl-8-ribityllumazine synthase [Bacteroidota bacterium]
MSSQLKNLSDYDAEGLSAKGLRFGIVVADWNPEITHALLKGAMDALTYLGCDKDSILLSHVPGSYELPLGAKWIADIEKPDAVICLGCVIQGETRHFDFICQAVSNGLMDLNLQYGLPFIFGVLTPENQEQALARAGGKHGNKGIEAAVTAVKMCLLKKH